ncbi:MAG: amidohydrolase family protein [Oscillospiraceae bacterium]|jgi:N-acyl-D-amino-acid deacylase|nr:amidohydrolase family protein [Oscillospiraceae bacterium]
MTTLLQNATIYDGTGDAPFVGDVLIEDDKIAQVAQGGITVPADSVIDLRGQSVAAGFIDAHSHNDWFAVKTDPIPYFEPFVRQGITGFVTGNCGLSLIGAKKDSPHRDKVGAGLFHNDESMGEFSTASELFDAVDQNSPVNIAACVGHCSVRAGIAGYENCPLTPDELDEMLRTMETALAEGACGASLGLMYEPGIYAPKEELRAVAELMEKKQKPLTVHARALSSVSLAYPSPVGRAHNLLALDELREMSRGLKLKLQYSHAIFVGSKTFKTHSEMLKIFAEMRAEGVDVAFDLYAETMGVSVITVIAPPWWLSMSKAERNKPLNKLKFTALAQLSMRLLGFDFGDIQIAYLGEGLEEYEGKRVSEIAREKHMKPLDAYIMLCDLSHNQGRVNQYKYSTPEILRTLSRHPDVLYMTDAWIEKKGVQNPAAFDCFPKFLQLSLRGEGDSMAQTVRKMSGAVADRFALPNRGYLKPGNYADITVFDENALRTGVPDAFRSFGITRVFINGHEVLTNDALNPAALRHAGRAMRVKGA